MEEAGILARSSSQSPPSQFPSGFVGDNSLHTAAALHRILTYFPAIFAIAPAPSKCFDSVVGIILSARCALVNDEFRAHFDMRHGAALRSPDSFSPCSSIPHRCAASTKINASAQYTSAASDNNADMAANMPNSGFLLRR
jgi:hypothetical protein